MPGHLGMKKTGRPLGRYDQFRGTRKWHWNVFRESDERSNPRQRGSMNLLRIAGVEGQMVVSAGSMIQQRAANLIVQLLCNLRLIRIDGMGLLVVAERHRRRIRQDHRTDLPPPLLQIASDLDSG